MPPQSNAVTVSMDDLNQPQVRTGTRASAAGPAAYKEGQVSLPNQGQVTTVDLDELSPKQAESPVDHSYSTELIKEIPWAAGQFGNGAARGLLHTATALPAYVASKIAPNSPQLQERERMNEPENPVQSIGHGVEQAGEFMLPGLGEEKAVSLLPGKLAPLGRIGYQALTSGGVNAAQGGGFGTGAAAGALTGALGEGMRAAAPGVAEKALGMRGTDRAFGKTPGRAILDETSGVRPESVAASAKAKIGELTPQLESAVAASPAMASLKPARDVLSEAASRAASHNAEGLHGQIGNMAKTIGQRFDTGAPIPEILPPRELLDLKRGFSEENLNWNPDRRDAALSAGRRAYGALDKSLDQAVPKAAPLNQRISSLIPTMRRGEAMARAEGAGPRVMERIARPTGALTGAIGGGMLGYRQGGATGAAEGAGLGLILPELMTSPTGRMALARALNRPLPAFVLPAIRGGALQLDRGKK